MSETGGDSRKQKARQKERLQKPKEARDPGGADCSAAGTVLAAVFLSQSVLIQSVFRFDHTADDTPAL